MKQKCEELIVERNKELEELRVLKKKLADSATHYTRQLQNKRDDITRLARTLEEEKERSAHSERILSRIVLMLKNIVSELFPEKNINKVTMDKAEEYLTLCGLSLEQKATILSFRNRSFPIESAGDDDRRDRKDEKKEEKQDEAFEKLEKQTQRKYVRMREALKNPALSLDSTL